MQPLFSVLALVLGLLVGCSLVVDESEAILSLSGGGGKRWQIPVPEHNEEGKRLKSKISLRNLKSRMVFKNVCSAARLLDCDEITQEKWMSRD